MQYFELLAKNWYLMWNNSYFTVNTIQNKLKLDIDTFISCLELLCL